LVLAGLAIVLMVSVPISLTLSARRSVGWEIERPLALLGGALLMGVGATVGILLTRSAWRGTPRPSVPVVGASLGLLLTVFGALLVARAVALFPGPLPLVLP
jgi:hypothetical protein